MLYPRMVSSIGKEIKREMRRNSISLASGIKRKNRPPKENLPKSIKDDSDMDLLSMSHDVNELYKNVKVDINFYCMSRDGSSVVLVNFYEGQTTIIETNNINKTSLGCTPQYMVTYE